MTTLIRNFNRLTEAIESSSLRTSAIHHSLNGIIIKCDSIEEAYNASTMFACLGVDVNHFVNFTDTYIQSSLSNNNVYCGIIRERFGMWRASTVSNAGGYRLHNINTQPHEGLIKNALLDHQAIICETPESAMYLGILLDNIDQKWSSGDRYTNTDMYFDRRHIGVGKGYDIANGVHGSISEFSNRRTLQELLFSHDRSLLLEPDAISFQDTRMNSIYVVHRAYPSSYAGERKRVVFKKTTRDLGGVFHYMESDGSIRQRRDLLGDSLPSIFMATDEEKRAFKANYVEFYKQLVANKAYERRLMLNSRDNRIKNAEKVRLREYYQYTEFQLLSTSLHGFLYKVWEENDIARKLLKLNNLGYPKGSLRNITISKSTQEMSYTLGNKDTVMTDRGRWEKKGRQQGKYGKILRKVLVEQIPNYKINDSELEKLVNHLKACADNGDFSVVDGDNILDWYDGDVYASDEDTGTLGSSCMRHNTYYMELYAKNPDVCKMVILQKDGVLYGRALLWNNKFMDRIYGSDSTITAFKAYAKRNGYHSKSAQNSDNIDRWINPESGEEYYHTFTINLDTNCEYYPYADTFYFVNTEDGTISNSDCGSHNAQLRSTDGDLYEDSRVYDEYDECYICEDDAVYLEGRGYYTHVNNASYCELSCESYLLEDMVELSNGDMAYQEREDVVYCDEDDVYAHIDDTFICEHADIIYCSINNNSEHIEELDMTVHELNVEEAYTENGYEYNDETMEWEKITSKQEA